MLNLSESRSEIDCGPSDMSKTINVRHINQIIINHKTYAFILAQSVLFCSSNSIQFWENAKLLCINYVTRECRWSPFAGLFPRKLNYSRVWVCLSCFVRLRRLEYLIRQLNREERKLASEENSCSFVIALTINSSLLLELSLSLHPLL